MNSMDPPKAGIGPFVSLLDRSKHSVARDVQRAFCSLSRYSGGGLGWGLLRTSPSNPRPSPPPEYREREKSSASSWRHTLIAAVLSISLLSAGCQSQHHADDLAQPVIAASTEGVDAGQTDAPQPYYNPHFREEKSGIPVLSAVGDAVVGGVVAIASVPINGIKWLSGERPINAVRMIEDGSSADNRRAGINKLLEYDFAKGALYTRLYRSVGQQDNDPTVRAAAIRACNRARDPQATALFIKSLDDKSDWVRLEAAKALVNIPDMAAVSPLLRIVSNPEENRDVRVAAADALKHYRTLTVARALAGVLADRDFAVSWQARQSLKYLFNRDLGYSDSAWLAYLTSPQSQLK
jgi:hypothetical protein